MARNRVDPAEFHRPLRRVLVGLLILLMLGLFTRFAAVAGALVIMALIFGSGLQQKWDAVSTQMIYAVFFFLVLHFLENNRYSLDHRRRR